MSNQDIQIKVCKAIADALGIDEGKVSPAISLVEELGAESLDFLDIIFRIEKTFQISLSREDLGMGLQEAEDGGRMSEEELGRELSTQERNQLFESFPGLDPARVKAGLKVRDIPGLITPGTLVVLVERKLNGVPQGKSGTTG